MTQLAIPMKTRDSALESGPDPVGHPRRTPAPVECRIQARGKFLFAREEKFYIKGVTYGPFRPDAEGCAYSNPHAVRGDFTLMAETGINAVRTYNRAPALAA